MIAEKIMISSSDLTLMTMYGDELADHGGLEDFPVGDGSTIQVVFNQMLIKSQGANFDCANKELLKSLTTTSPSSSSHRPSPTPRLAEQAVVDAVSAHRLAQQALAKAVDQLEEEAAEQAVAVDEAEAALATSSCRTVTNGYESGRCANS